MRILFQGDSITDAGRSRENNDCLGAGYPHLLKAALGFEEPGKYEFFNRGISSNRVVDLYTRIKAEPSYWLKDGVHPTEMGHGYIKTNGLSCSKHYDFWGEGLNCIIME